MPKVNKKNFADLDKIMFFLARVLTVEPSAEYLNIMEEGKVHVREQMPYSTFILGNVSYIPFSGLI